VAATPPPPPKVEKAKPAPVAKAPEEPKPKVHPETATLEPGDPGVQLVIDVEGSHGGRRDLTAKAKWEAEPAGVVTVGPEGYCRPIGPGKAKVRGVVEGRRVEAEVTVADQPRAWDFAADVTPILTRFGCNTGGCHGKADGQNGFHLSLFGYDPEGDYRALTREGAGRRLEPMAPEESLLIRKVTGRTPHAGGMRLVAGSDEYNTLLAWIRAGAPERQEKSHGALTKVTVEPGEVRLDEPGPVQLRVVAHFADGHRRDVTRLATYRVNDDTAADVDPNGKARLIRRAEVDLIVRFKSDVVATRIATLINPDLKFDFAKLPRQSFVDDLLYKRLESLKVPPSPPAGDAAFLRRVSLDLTGEYPQTQDVRDYLADTDPEKRIKLVDRLMASRAFVQFWQIKFGDMLQISQNRLARFQGSAGQYQVWLTGRLTKNTPWDAMVRELLTALGDPSKPEGGPANFALDGQDAKEQAELAAQRFLGLRIRCAQCHDHPFDVWTQDDYYGMAAFFAKVGRGGGPGAGGMMGRPVVKVDPEGKIEHLRTKKEAEPRLPDRTPVKLDKADDPRKALADWMTRPDNPYFARAMANWVWAQFFGKGLTDPPDDLSRSNPPVHPELLDALAKHFVEHKYDLRELIRTVAISNAYAASSAAVPGNERDTRFFSHQMPRPLTAHQMADALAEVTGVPNRFGQLGKRKAIEINDPSTPSPILDTFGRCPRTNGCSSVPTPSLSLRQSLLLIGGDVVDGKVSSLNGYLVNLLKLEPTPEEVVENLYFRTLCRPPTDKERAHWAEVLKKSPSLGEAAEDLFWALLNSREFAFNH
jgi:hypothetical protein